MTQSIRILAAMLALLLLLSACSPTATADDFAYAQTTFTAVVRGTYTPSNGTSRPLAARISVGAPIPGQGDTARPMTVTFTSPKALSGVTVTAVYETDAEGNRARTVTFTYPSAYGEVKTTAETTELDGYLRFAEALLPIGDITRVSPAAEDGTHTVARTTADGKREAVFLFSSEQALPLRVTVHQGDTTIEFTVTP